MENMDTKIKEITETTNLDRLDVPETVIMLGLGLTVLLFGYRIKRIAFFIIWFLLGFNLMGVIMPFVNQNVAEIAGSELYQTLLPIAGGILLALLGFSIEKLCVGGICFVLTMLVAVQYFGTDIQTMAVGGVIGVLVAGFAVMMMKPATIIATAVAGAYALTLAILRLNTEMSFESFYWPMILGISAIGAIFQFATTKRIS